MVLVFDTLVIWLLLNMFSQQNWSDQKLKVFGIAIAITLLGSLSAQLAIPYIRGFPVIGLGLVIVLYAIIGTICLWGLASLEFKKAAAAMGLFTVYKFAIAIAVLFIFPPVR